MTTKSKIASIPLTGVTIAYYFTLAAIFLASTFPTCRVWGLNWWAYFPLWVRLGLLAVGIVMPLVIDRVLNRLLADRDDISARTYRWLIGGFAIVMVALFYLLRERTYFLGDGYTLLSSLKSENPLIKPRNFGGTIIQYGILKLLNGEGEAGALLAYQIVSIAAGISFIGITIWAASRLISKNTDRFLFVLLACTGGYALMFFGYVENYSFFVVLIAAFCLLGLAIIDKKAGRLWVIPLIAVASIFHIFGVVLTLPALYLLFYETALWHKLTKWPAVYKILLSVLVLGIVEAVFAYFYRISWFFRLSLLPLWPNMFTVDGYTLFSISHLVDFFNLILLLFPGLFVVVLTFFKFTRRSLSLQTPQIFLTLTAVSCAGAAFIFNPGLGMPRDWDLFAFMGVPIILGSVGAFFSGMNSKLDRRNVLLGVALNVLVLIPRAVTLVTPTITIQHITTYAEQDPSKSSVLWYLLVSYYSQAGDSISVKAASDAWIQVHPDEVLIDAAHRGDAVDTLMWEQAVRRSVSNNPISWTAWGNLGVVYLRSGDYDSALFALQIAVELNPYNSANHANLAYAHFYRNEYEPAERYWIRAHRLDSTSVQPLVGLAKLYEKTGDEQKYANYFAKIVARADAPPEYLRMLGNWYLAQGKFKEAAQTFRRAVANGMTPAAVDSIVSRYPQLRDIITQ